MALDYLSYDDFVAQIRAKFRNQIPAIDPTIFGSWARGFTDGNAVLAQSNQDVIRDLAKQLFPQTATGSFLDIWGGYEDLERKDESAATGYATLDDTTVAVGTVIPALSDFNGSNGIIYQSTAVATITAVNQAIDTITRSGTTATATTLVDHQLSTGLSPTMSGATQPEYNVTAIITVTARDTFTYQVTGTPATPATGSPEYDINIASINFEAQETGLDTNLESGAQLSSDTYGTALTQYDGMSGGASEETDDEYRVRILLSRSIIEGVFTPDQIKLAALSIAGNTRAFVKKPTLAGAGGAVDPEPGETSVFILRDNDANIIPTATVLAATKVVVIEDGALPGNTDEASLYLVAPTLVPTDFVFTTLVPDTPTMRTAVEDQLKAFFEDTVNFETAVTEASYLGTIQNTQDLQTGAFLESFSLSAPSATISITAGEIASLGDVDWSAL